MKIELGGGVTPRGDGFVNVDIKPCADIICDFELGKLPFDDDSVDEIYSSHCLEHVRGHIAILGEVLRICRHGAKVELRFPHWLHPMASSPGHVHVLSDRQVSNWLESPKSRELFWPQATKRFVEDLGRRHYQIEVDYFILREKFPQLTDEEVARYIPGCCHEVRYYFTVAALMTSEQP